LPFLPTGQQTAGGLPDRFLNNSQGAIIAFDVTTPSTYASVPDWYRDVERFCPGIPIILCGNKVDVEVRSSPILCIAVLSCLAAKNRKVKTAAVTFHRQKDLHYFEMSAQSGYNTEKVSRRSSLGHSLMATMALSLASESSIATRVAHDLDSRPSAAWPACIAVRGHPSIQPARKHFHL
jgi:GTP-binding nuclear protein Ran